MPVGVLVPKSDRDVAVALEIARELAVPVLPRGAGTSQCGQTTGAALVIDTTKHLRNVVAVDAERRVATVEPGLVLDHLNAQLKPLGLWFPVDVSTSAQATIGGMAGNNSCGSRSIAYGNMVHNVLGIDTLLADGAAVSFGPMNDASGRAAAIGAFVRDLALRNRGEIEARWPKVLRRVAGYNLDIFQPQSEKPYTGDGSVNLAHLLVGAEGTLAWSRTLTLKLAPLPSAKVLGVVNFPTFHAAMDAARQIVTLGPTAVELVDRTMIDLALADPAFAATMTTALRGQPAAILLVEFAGDAKQALLTRLGRLVELMGDLSLPGSVVEMTDEAAQKNLWEVRKAGLNIMMSLKGDGKPVSFIEDCAVPLEYLAEYTDALTEVFARHGTRGTWYAHASVGTLHVGRFSTCGAMARERCDRSPKRRRCWCASSRAPSAASTATACAAASGSSGSSAPTSTTRSARSRTCSIRTACSTPARSSIRRRWTTARCSASRRRKRRRRTGPSHSCPRSTGRRGTCRTIRARRRSARPEPATTRPAVSPRRSRCATTTATAASSTPARCARAFARRVTSSM